MGQIWAADHVTLQRRVAVKCLSGALAENAVALRRFAFEAQTLARLQTDHVPQIFDYAALSDGTPFIAMELLDGIELQERVRKNLLSLAETARMVGQVCVALTSVHALGIVHRDVKPPNIFLVPCEDGLFTAKLIDFGIAKALGDLDSDDLIPKGSVLGTPNYMSPERLAGVKDMDGRADLWSLAIVAYYCLTGQLPFPGDTLTAVWLSIHGGDIAGPSALRSDLPLELDAWFRKAFNRDPDARFASAAEAAASFSIAAGSAPAEGDAAMVSRLRRRRGDSQLELVWLTMPNEPYRPRRGRRPRAALTWLSVVSVIAAIAAFEPGWTSKGSFATYRAAGAAGAPSQGAAPAASPRPELCPAPDAATFGPPMSPVRAPAAASSISPRRPRPSPLEKGHSGHGDSRPGAH